MKENSTPHYILIEQSVHASIGPFNSMEEALDHLNFVQKNNRYTFLGILTEESLRTFFTDAFVIDPQWDRNLTKNRDNSKILAEEWIDAYSADLRGRAVSEKIIEAALDFGASTEDIKDIYFSKHLRWFFDNQPNNLSPGKAYDAFHDYLARNRYSIREMISKELGRVPTI